MRGRDRDEGKKKVEDVNNIGRLTDMPHKCYQTGKKTERETGRHKDRQTNRQRDRWTAKLTGLINK